MTSTPTVKIKLEGHVDDLYAMSLLFPEGAYSDLSVITKIKGAKEGLLDRALDASCQDTYLTGEGCLPLIYADGFDQMRWVAMEIMAPLNGYAVLTDSNFRPVTPVSATWESEGRPMGAAAFKQVNENKPTRLISSNRHSRLRELLPGRVTFMRDNPLAAYAASVISGPPSWADYYRLLEDIAGHCKTTLEKLDEAGLASRMPLSAFKMAANNRAFGRHGVSKRNTNLSQDELMNLLEAREFVKNVVCSWLDRECGDRLPRDRVDGGPLRFGLDNM